MPKQQSYVYRAFQALIIGNIFLLPNFFINYYQALCYVEQMIIKCIVKAKQKLKQQIAIPISEASNSICLCALLSFFILIWFTCEVYCRECLVDCCYPERCGEAGAIIFYLIKPIFLILNMYLIFTFQPNYLPNDQNIIAYALRPSLDQVFVALIDATFILIYNQLCCCIKKNDIIYKLIELWQLNNIENIQTKLATQILLVKY